MKRQSKESTSPAAKPDPWHAVSRFNLSFLDKHGPGVVYSYETSLQTAEEKTAHYDDLIKNDGRESSEKITKSLRKKASKLRKQLAGIDPDEVEPLLERIEWLESLARYHADPIPPDVLAAQKEDYSGPSGINITADMTDKLRVAADNLGIEMEDLDAQPEDSAQTTVNQLQKLETERAFWRRIHNWSPLEAVLYYFCGHPKPQNWTEAMFVRAQQDPFAAKLLASEASRSMVRLLDLAELGNECAIEEAVAVLERSARHLNACAKIQPAAFRNVASRTHCWPVVFSPHPRLNQLPVKITSELKLGSGLAFEFGATAKWHPNDKACKIAIELYKIINQIRRFPASNTHSPFYAEALALPEIGESESVGKWWNVAKKILLDGVPKPQKDKHLRNLTGIKKKFKVRSKILEILKNRFDSLFPKMSR